MYLFSRAFRLAGITALLALPGMAMAQATIPNYEFSSAAVDYPAGGGQNYSLQGTLGQTFATVDPPTNAGQNLVYGGFGETAVPFLYKGTVALGDFNGVISSIPITFHLFNNIDHKISDEQTGFADNAGNFSVYSWVNPSAVESVSLKGNHWLRQNTTLNLGDPVNGYPTASFSLLNGDINGDNYVGLDDLGFLSDAFDTKPGDALWNPLADLNGDNVVGLDDLGILSLNFDIGGDK